MLEVILLWYRKFRNDLETVGIKFNTCYPCVANRTINRKQHTLRLHVDDILSSHVDPKINYKFAKWAKEK